MDPLLNTKQIAEYYLAAANKEGETQFMYNISPDFETGTNLPD
jgi:hypothetical protein